MKVIGITHHSARGLFIAVSILISLICFSQLAYMQVKASLAQILLTQAWQETLQIYQEDMKSNKSKGKGVIDELFKVKAKVKPWPWADVYPVAKLLMLRLEQSYLVLNNDSGQALAFGPGLSGANLNNEVVKTDINVISGHRDSHFEFLADLVLGDELSVELPSGQIVYYIVSKLSVIDTRENQLYLPDNEENQPSGLVLITCYPFNSVTAVTPFRLVVEASMNS